MALLRRSREIRESSIYAWQSQEKAIRLHQMHCGLRVKQPGVRMSSMDSVEVNEVKLSNCTCWMIGAGASYDCIGEGDYCVPMTYNLIRNANITDELRRQLTPLIDDGQLSANSFKDAIGPRIERTIDELRGLTSNSNSAMQVQAAQALRQMVRVVSAMISVGSLSAMCADEEGFRAENYAWLAFQSCRFPQWSIVTMNYDLVLDWAFEFLNRIAESRLHEKPAQQYVNWRSIVQTLSQNPSVKSLGFSSGAYVKLHGCLELFSCQNIACARYRVPYLPDPSNLSRPMFYGERKEVCPACRSEAVELILPPGKNKTREEGIYHDWIYPLAEAVAKRASAWVILGYSCPDYDEDVVEVLRNALEGQRNNNHEVEIYVVTPDANLVADRLSRRISHTVYAYPSTFSQLVASARQKGRIKRSS